MGALSEAAGHACQGEVVRFRTTAREHHLVGAGPHEAGHMAARPLNGRACRAALRVQARRIAKFGPQVWSHRRADPWVEWRRRGVVKVDTSAAVRRSGSIVGV